MIKDREDLFWTLDTIKAQPHEIDLVIEGLANHTFSGCEMGHCLIGLIATPRASSYYELTGALHLEEPNRFKDFEARFIISIYWFPREDEEDEPAHEYTNAQAALMAIWLKEYIQERNP